MEGTAISTRITALGIARPLVGACQPVLMHCSGDTRYVVKLTDNPERSAALIGEWVCYQLAGDLEVPVPEYALVNVPPELADVSTNDIPWITPGVHFGSRFAHKAIRNPPEKLSRRAVNVRDIPSILAFDYLVYNRDRASNEGNLLYTETSEGWGVTAIDFSHAFYSPLWLLEDTMLRQRVNEFDPNLLNGRVYRRLLPFINGHSPFDSFVSSLSRLNLDRIRHIIDTVPEEWGLSPEKGAALAGFLVERAKQLPQQLHNNLKNHLPYWKGGEH